MVLPQLSSSPLFNSIFQSSDVNDVPFPSIIAAQQFDNTYDEYDNYDYEDDQYSQSNSYDNKQAKQQYTPKPGILSRYLFLYLICMKFCV